MIRAMLILLISISMSGCVESSSANQSSNIDHTVVSSGIQMGIDNQQTHVLRNAATYSTFISSTQILGVIPNPDFTQNMLVGIFSTLGSCDSLSVSSVEDLDGSIVISLSSTKAEVCTAVVGNHYLFIEMAQSTKQVSVIYKIN